MKIKRTKEELKAEHQSNVKSELEDLEIILASTRNITGCKSILAIDPGNITSGIVVALAPDLSKELKYTLIYAQHGVKNEDLFDIYSQIDEIVMEKPIARCASTTVGDTIFWAGRFYEHAMRFFTDCTLYSRSIIRGLFVNKYTRTNYPDVNLLNNADAQIRFLLEKVAIKEFNVNDGVKFSNDSWQAFALLYFHLVKTAKINPIEGFKKLK